MTELHRGDKFLKVGIGRILVKLALSDLCRKCGAPELEAVVFEPHSRAEKPLPRERHGKGLINRPVVLRCEFEVFVIQPRPSTRNFGRNFDSGSDRLLDLPKRRRGLAETDV